MRPGEIHHHGRFYLDTATGEIRGKFLLVLAALPGDDLVARLLTSRPHGRPTAPPCFHGDPYPSYFLGKFGGLRRETWIDLRYLPDLDAGDVTTAINRGVLTFVQSLDTATFRDAANCTAAANDTTRQQERAIRNQLARTG